MYVLFVEMVDPDVFTINTQQTPKPDAQFPLAVPPFDVHSLWVKQVPLRTVLGPDNVKSMLLLQTALLKLTTLKMGKTLYFRSSTSDFFSVSFSSVELAPSALDDPAKFNSRKTVKARLS